MTVIKIILLIDDDRLNPSSFSSKTKPKQSDICEGKYQSQYRIEHSLFISHNNVIHGGMVKVIATSSALDTLHSLYR